ncbi:MAG: Hsp20/alpha crystallin family protein [Patescibacteria group bacterium]
MSLIRFRQMWPSLQNLDNWFDESGVNSFNLSNFVPALDIYQTSDEVIVETPLPGIDPAKVNISIENDVLTIEGHSEQKTEVDEKNYYRKEIRAGSFHRSAALPTAVNGDKAQATYEKGILKVIIPKEERAKPKTVKIQIK